MVFGGVATIKYGCSKLFLTMFGQARDHVWQHVETTKKPSNFRDVTWDMNNQNDAWLLLQSMDRISESHANLPIKCLPLEQSGQLDRTI